MPAIETMIASDRKTTMNRTPRLTPTTDLLDAPSRDDRGANRRRHLPSLPRRRRAPAGDRHEYT